MSALLLPVVLALSDPRVACGPDGCLVAYRLDDRDDVAVARVGWDDRVELLGRPYSEQRGHTHPVLLVSGGEEGEVHLLVEAFLGTTLEARVLGPDGQALAPAVELSRNGIDPRGVWDGQAFVVAWGNATDEISGPASVSLALIGADGSVRAETLLASGPGPWGTAGYDAVAVATTGDLTWIAWPVRGQADESPIVGIRLDADGNLVDETPMVLLANADRPKLAAREGRFLLLGRDLTTAGTNGLLLDESGPVGGPFPVAEVRPAVPALALHPLGEGWIVTWSTPGWAGAPGVEALRLDASGHAVGAPDRLADGASGTTTVMGDRVVAASLLGSERIVLTRKDAEGSTTVAIEDEPPSEQGCTVAAGRRRTSVAGVLALLLLGVAVRRARRARLVLVLVAAFASLAFSRAAEACGGGGGGGGGYVGEIFTSPALACGPDDCLLLYHGDHLYGTLVGTGDHLETLEPPDLDFVYPMSLSLTRGGGVSLALVGAGGSALRAAILDDRGQAVAPAVPLAASAVDPVAAWDGNAFVIAWGMPRGEDFASVALARLAPDGRVLASATLLDDVWARGAVESIAVASAGGVTWLAWPMRRGVDQYPIVGLRVDAQGAPLDDEPLVLLEDATRPRLAAHDGRFLLVARDLFDEDGQTLVLDGEGPLAEAQPLAALPWTRSEHPVLHALGKGWLASWTTNSSAPVVRALRLDADGTAAEAAYDLAQGEGAVTTSGDRVMAASVYQASPTQQVLLFTREEGDRSKAMLLVDESTWEWVEPMPFCTISAGRAGGRTPWFLALCALACLFLATPCRRPSIFHRRSTGPSSKPAR